MINWDSTKKETELITKIAKRATKEAKKLGIDYPVMDASMDVAAIHLNDCKLRLKELLDTDVSNFLHDIFGIRRFIDRKTGTLTDCFLPRFSA